ncbi:MAG: 5-oxoprolinase subunit PxpB [Chitinophagaceae bacterium]|nr:5-oxoprolinase subunit PxpB [Chitinophagaceae bacterium]
MIQTYTLGEHAVVVQLGWGISIDVHERVMAYTRAVEAAHFSWVLELVPAYNSVTVYYSITTLSAVVKKGSIAAWVSNTLTQLKVDFNATSYTNQQTIEIPACYDPLFGADLGFLSEQLKLSIDKIIEIHSNRIYKVYMLGFLPGFPYMGSVDESIQYPRKKNPSQQIAAGSIGIAGAQTGIYPLLSPGGWQIIGRTPLTIFNVEKEQPSLLSPGNQVKFIPITLERFYEIEKEKML